MKTVKADSKGRVTLGAGYGGAVFVVHENKHGVILERVIPRETVIEMGTAMLAELSRARLAE